MIYIIDAVIMNSNKQLVYIQYYCKPQYDRCKYPANPHITNDSKYCNRLATLDFDYGCWTANRYLCKHHYNRKLYNHQSIEQINYRLQYMNKLIPYINKGKNHYNKDLHRISLILACIKDNKIIPKSVLRYMIFPIVYPLMK
jgi:hypothetical protein